VSISVSSSDPFFFVEKMPRGLPFQMVLRPSSLPISTRSLQRWCRHHFSGKRLFEPVHCQKASLFSEHSVLSSDVCIGMVLALFPHVRELKLGSGLPPSKPPG